MDFSGIPAIAGNKIFFVITWFSVLTSTTISVLLAQDLVPAHPAAYIGVGALLTGFMGLVVPVLKMWLDQRDKDRAAMMESTRVASQLSSAFSSINMIQMSFVNLQKELESYRDKSTQILENLLDNQKKYLELHPEIKK